MKLKILSLLAAFLAKPLILYGGERTYLLEMYLDDVKQNNKSYQASKAKSAALMQRQREPSLLFEPSLFSDMQIALDQRPNAMRSTMGDQTRNERFSFGIMQQSRYGTSQKVSYGLSHTNMKGVNLRTIPLNNYYDSGLTVEFSQPLIKNSFGEDFALQEQIGQSSLLAASEGESFSARMVLIEAESIYWKLATTEQIFQIQKESYDRTFKIMQWQERRFNQNLVDETDLVQIQAALKLRELELQSTKDELENIKRSFNFMRGMEISDQVSTLYFPHQANVVTMQIPEKTKERGDLIAAKHAFYAASQQSALNKNKYKPSLDLFASASLNARNEKISEAIPDNAKTNHPLAAFGVKFSMPLAGEIISASSFSYESEAASARMSYEQKKLDEQNQWNDLNIKFKNIQNRLKIVFDLEKIQKKKMDGEKQKFEQGRSTSYQLFLFEQDYLASALTRIQLISQALLIQTNLKAFEGEAL